MKVLVADKFPNPQLEALGRLGCSVTYQPEAGARGLELAIADHDVLVVRSSKVTSETLLAGKRLQLVVRAGAGVNTIDVKMASERGVYVTNCPGKNAVAVAELTLGLLVALDRRIPAADAELRRGHWNKKEYSKAAGLLGKTLGVVGVGQIGVEVITRARAFGLEVLAWSRSLNTERASALGARHVESLSALAERSDIVSLHLALTKDTRHLIGAEFLGRMKRGALLVNTAREGIVDERALLAALDERGLRYASDVFDGEPAGGTAEWRSAVAAHPNTVVTPHIGASTEQAQNAVADETVRIIETFQRTGQALNCVNLCRESPARWQLNVRHLDRVGVLATVLGSLREADINVEEVENIIFEGAQAACARIRLSSQPPATLVDELAHVEHVLDARLLAL